MSQEELRHCLNAQRTINVAAEALDKFESEIEQFRQRLDRRDPVSVADFNAFVSRFNGEAREIERDVGLFNASCAGKPYRARDLATASAQLDQQVRAQPPPTIEGLGLPTVTQCQPNSVFGPMLCPKVPYR